MKQLWSILGIILAVLSLSSLIQNAGQIELSEYFAQSLAYYRDVRDAAQWLLFDWWAPLVGIDVWMPAFGMDLLAIWSLSATATIRMDQAATDQSEADPIEVDDEEFAFELSFAGRALYFIEVIIFAPVGYVRSLIFAVRMVAATGQSMWDAIFNADQAATLEAMERLAPGAWASFAELRSSYIRSFFGTLYLLLLLLATPLLVLAFFVWNSLSF